MPKILFDQLPSKKWRARVFDRKDEKGRRIYKSFTAEKKKDARAAAEAWAKENNLQCNSYSDLTLKQAYERYIAAKEGTLSPSTIQGYVRSKNNDFPLLMNLKLREITPELVQTAVSEAAVNYSPKSVRNQHGLLRAVLKMYNPGLHLSTKLPQKEKKEINVPTSDEVRNILEQADERLRVPILLASAGSLRRSEICALTPDDVSDIGVTVNKAAVYDKNKKIVIKQPKSTAGYRTVPLSPEIIKEIKAWKYFNPTPAQLHGWWARFKEKNNITFKFHAFRHYFASELHAQGVPDKYIMRAGGWSSVDILHNIYSHTLRDKEKEFNNKIIDIFQKNISTPSTRKKA